MDNWKRAWKKYLQRVSRERGPVKVIRAPHLTAGNRWCASIQPKGWERKSVYFRTMMPVFVVGGYSGNPMRIFKSVSWWTIDTSRGWRRAGESDREVREFYARIAALQK